MGINGGIGLGIVVAIFDFVWTTANVSSVIRVSRRSLALWGPQARAFIDRQYHTGKIATLQLTGSVFFGSSMLILSNILEEAGVNVDVDEKVEINRVNSPLPNRRINNLRVPGNLSPSPSPVNGQLEQRRKERTQQPERRNILIPPRKVPPRFLVLDLSTVSNVDASAARGCFLQLAKMCHRRKIVVCAAGGNSRIHWMLLTHDTAQNADVDALANGTLESNELILLFDDLDEALKFAEKTLVAEVPGYGTLSPVQGDSAISLSTAFTHFLGLEEDKAAALIEYEKQGHMFHSETRYTAGKTIFSSGTEADGFYVVLSGSVIIVDDNQSGKGGTKPVGSMFGFVDFILNRPRTFSAIAGRDTLIAMVNAKDLDELKRTHPDIDRIVDKVLLLCSTIELDHYDM